MEVVEIGGDSAFRRKINMSYGVYMSAAGANVQNHRLQVLSNNLANVETPGYRPQNAILQARFSEMIEEGNISPGLGGADDVGGGVTAQEVQTQFAVGPIRQTGNKTDFAINEEGSFFVVEEGDEQRLTRAGNFLFDASGKMITQSGQQVMGKDGKPIQIDPRLPYQTLDGGRIDQLGIQQELMIARPKSLGDLAHLGGNEFKPLAEFDLADATERPVVTGALEQSGVNPTSAMMELIETSRVYEANVRMIQNQDQVTGQLVSRVL
ncbi:Flagellar basal-body rod protein FlgG [Roseimaritima multifibrata]|uniref:Flagellar basal-body rod protein FlgG n=1 Tax=Roseimaritima multifibrata TaxID=1930274 RepID=A0A517ML60_9BACT|nr:flagellar hook basal-body protein [Roseimaritima multifibrata]QDS95580.1 Flagellar basal-body rod protein FlgG [Roseimaritima multifibrata]